MWWAAGLVYFFAQVTAEMLEPDCPPPLPQVGPPGPFSHPNTCMSASTGECTSGAPQRPLRQSVRWSSGDIMRPMTMVDVVVLS